MRFQELGTTGGVLLLLLSMAATTVVGCAEAVVLQPKVAAGECQGSLTVIKKKHGIRVLKIAVDDIPALNRATANPSAYVVWARSGNDPIHSIGTLRIRDDRGVLETLAPPSRSFRLYVTAESSGTVQAPAGREVFVADVAAD
jgi:hypothetical protein